MQLLSVMKLGFNSDLAFGVSDERNGFFLFSGFLHAE